MSRSKAKHSRSLQCSGGIRLQRLPAKNCSRDESDRAFHQHHAVRGLAWRAMPDNTKCKHKQNVRMITQLVQPTDLL